MPITNKYNQPKTFALIGAAGYIAPRHMQAIKDTGNILVAAMDKSDSVGVIDSFFPDAAFFTEFERFDRHLEKLKRNDSKIDYLVICTPNYLHDAHIRFGLKNDYNVIIEKPIVLTKRNLEALIELEKESIGKVSCILQMRLHPEAIRLKKEIEKDKNNKLEVTLSYIAPRGTWYYASWKGDEKKSGGICTNIGVHLFDLLLHLFGSVTKNEIHLRRHDRTSGYLQLERANITWFLSINNNTLPEKIEALRVIETNNQKYDFSKGFNNLHVKSYQNILEGNSFSMENCIEHVLLLEQLRTQNIEESERKHELAKLKTEEHPFFNKQ